MRRQGGNRNNYRRNDNNNPDIARNSLGISSSFDSSDSADLRLREMSGLQSDSDYNTQRVDQNQSRHPPIRADMYYYQQNNPRVASLSYISSSQDNQRLSQTPQPWVGGDVVANLRHGNSHTMRNIVDYNGPTSAYLSPNREMYPGVSPQVGFDAYLTLMQPRPYQYDEGPLIGSAYYHNNNMIHSQRTSPQPYGQLVDPRSFSRDSGETRRDKLGNPNRRMPKCGTVGFGSESRDSCVIGGCAWWVSDQSGKIISSGAIPVVQEYPSRTRLEFKALFHGLHAAHSQGITSVVIKGSDSFTLTYVGLDQFPDCFSTVYYMVKDLHLLLRQLVAKFADWKTEFVPYEKNAFCKKLATRTMSKYDNRNFNKTETGPKPENIVEAPRIPTDAVNKDDNNNMTTTTTTTINYESNVKEGKENQEKHDD